MIGQVEDGVRRVVLVRGLAGKTPDHYTFDPRVASVPVISASGTGAVFSYHGPKQRSGLALSIELEKGPPKGS